MNDAQRLEQLEIENENLKLENGRLKYELDRMRDVIKDANTAARIIEREALRLRTDLH